ncbi:MAG: flagellar brake protein [Pseudomonadota bacterium]|nr:flagellar brake protein [Pseudomonadota bacterium]
MRRKDNSGSKGDPPVLCPGLTIGAYVHVALEGAGACRGLFIGMEFGQYLLIKLPLAAEIGCKLYMKNHVIIRYVHGGIVYGFRSTLIGLVRESIRLAIFAYPEAVESMNLRKEERFACLLPGVVKLMDPEGIVTDWKGSVTDLSGGGCSFEIVSGDGVVPELRIGMAMQLQFRLPDAVTALDMESELRTIQEDRSLARLGLRFRDAPAREAQRDNKMAIRLFLADLKKKFSLNGHGSAL